MEEEPSYLPWLARGEEVPEPKRVTDGATSYVIWSSDEDRSGHTSAVFRRDSEPIGGKGEPVSVMIEGAAGYFYGGAGRDAAILWKLDSQDCDLITLQLSLPEADAATLRKEVIRIAESLRQ